MNLSERNENGSLDFAFFVFFLYQPNANKIQL